MSAKYRILSIDGGGIRGIFPATILSHIEKMLQRIYRDPSYRVADYFDFFAGTSTGGILVCLYLCSDGERPTYSADDVLTFILTVGVIYSGSRYITALGLPVVSLTKNILPKAWSMPFDDYFGDQKLSGC